MAMSVGQCPQCQSDNAYSRTECHVCGARLPWADAVAGRNGAISSSDESSFILALLGFFCWPAGVIVWALQRDQYPRRSGSALNGAIASWVASFALIGLLFLVRTSANNARNQSQITVYSSISPVTAPNQTISALPTVSTPPPVPSPPPSLYHRIKLDMSYAEVVKALGRKEDQKRVAGNTTVYQWKTRTGESDAAHRGTTCSVAFNNGSIASIDQH